MKSKAIFIGILLAVGLAFGINAQQRDFAVLEGPYLGQKPPGRQRAIFAPGVVSTGYNEHGVSFTPDGREIFWRLLGPPHGVTLTMKGEKGGWTSPQVPSFSGKYDGKCSLSPDGNTILMSCGSPPSGEGPPLDYWTIWIIKRTNSGWGKPQNLPHLMGAYPTISNNGTIYFYARGENEKGDIYRALSMNGKYGEAQKIEAPISTEYWENDPYVAPDESYLIFQSTRPGTLGRGDLFISYRMEEGGWTEPKNLGKGINTKESGEGCPWVTPDGKYLFFSSGTWTLPNYSTVPLTLKKKIEILSQPGHGSEDVFWVDAKIIEDLKPKDDFPVLKGPYLGQKPPGMTPEIFAPGIASTDCGEFNSVFSPDGNEFYYSQTNKEKKKDQIMSMKRVNDRWTKPEIAPFSGEYDDCDMSISHDGQRFFFISIGRILPGGSTPTKRNYLWFMEKTQSGWGEPQLLEYPGNVGGVYPISTNNGTLYFSSRLEENFGGADIYRSQFVSGSYAAPENLGSAINSKYSESDTFVAPDESFMIVTCWERPGNIGGAKSDLYISFRKRDSSWTTLQNMGKLINTEYIEFCPMLSPDGKYFFFSSDRTDVEECDIYWVDAKVVEELKPKELK